MSMRAGSIENIHNECTGCAACVNICPLNNIAMVSDNEGFLHPVIEKENCVQCKKCDKVCPVINGNISMVDILKSPKVFAVWADDVTRFMTSSGGAFAVLARHVIRNLGGVASGAAWANDFKSVQHRIIENETDLNCLLKSKYVQSEINCTFQILQQFLSRRRPVVFCGCPCQIAGLRRFLNKKYENLFLIDLVCHGVPSPKAWETFINEIDAASSSKIVNVDCRDKTNGWHSNNLTLTLANGEKITQSHNEKGFLRLFLDNIALRNSCYKCQYANMKRQGDITLGDFWGIRKYATELDDGKGTSLVVLNTKTGENVFNDVRNQYKLIHEVPYDFASKSQINLYRSSPSYPEKRAAFFSNLGLGFYRAIEAVNKIRVALVGWYFNENFGGAITVLALHETLRELGYDVTIVKHPNHFSDNPHMLATLKIVNRFYQYTTVYEEDELVKLNDIFNTFVLASDQVWNYELDQISRPLRNYLGFVNVSKRKIACAASFGSNKHSFPPHLEPVLAKYISNFDFISVREKSGVEICKALGADAVFVLDPVFWVSENLYAKLSSINQRTELKKFTLIYSMGSMRHEELANIGKKISDLLGLPLITLVSQCKKPTDFNGYGLTDCEDFSEWCYFLMKADFIVTQSFHGICFAIIFNKPFIALTRGFNTDERVLNLVKLFGLENRLFNNDNIDYSVIFEQIDYAKINKIVIEGRKTARKFLKNALTAQNCRKAVLFNPFSRNTIDNDDLYLSIDSRLRNIESSLSFNSDGEK